jgi:hypothetical protein
VSRRLLPPWEPVEPPPHRAPAPRTDGRGRVQRPRPRQDLQGHPGWEPLDEEKGNAFGQALRDAVTAARPKTSARNVCRLLQGEAVSLQQGQAAETVETVTMLENGTKITDRRRVC